MDFNKQLQPCPVHPDQHVMHLWRSQGENITYICEACNTQYVFWRNGKLNGRYPLHLDRIISCIRLEGNHAS